MRSWRLRIEAKNTKKERLFIPLRGDTNRGIFLFYGHETGQSLYFYFATMRFYNIVILNLIPILFLLAIIWTN